MENNVVIAENENLTENKNSQKHVSIQSKFNKYAYFFLIPFFVVFLIFSLYPMVYSIVISFCDLKGLDTVLKFNNFENYIWLWNQPRFWQSFLNTFIIFAMNFIPQLVSAVFFAVMFTSRRLRMKCKGIFQFVFFLPNIITAASVAILFAQLLGHNGSLHKLFVEIGFINEDYNFFLNKWPSKIIIAFVQFWMWFGNSMIIYISGIKGISDDIFEAADMDGAGPFRIVFRIILPLIKPIVLYSLISSIIGGLQMFDIPQLLTNGGPANATETITMYIYQFAFSDADPNYGMAAAGSVYLFAVSLFFSILLFKVMNRKPKRRRRNIKPSTEGVAS